MKKEKYIFGILGLIIGLIIGLILGGNKINTNSVDGLMNSQNRMFQNENIDSHFIEQMIPHHNDAIEMSKLALVKAQHPQLKQFAKNIIETQTKENNQMKTWYKEWFNKELSEDNNNLQYHEFENGMGMHMGIRGDGNDLTQLETSENFDISFIELMIPHHQMAIMMSSMLTRGTNRQEMKMLSNEIIKTQTKEIEQMRKWLIEWNN